MKQLPKFSKVLLASGVAAFLVCSLAYAESSSATSTTSKSSPHKTTSKSTAHKTTGSASKSHTASKSPKSSKSSSTKSTKAGAHKGKRSRKTARGQQKIDGDRTQQIQQALIRQHYLSGEPSGKWDALTEDALRRYQADNGWQNKTVPDSRALIKLGLGPSHDHLLNPESAMTTSPEPGSSRVDKPASGPTQPTPVRSEPN